MRLIRDYNVLIVGSGAAGFAVAANLAAKGVGRIAILTESRATGTSRNTGSDKQTYYKVSLAGDDGDCPFEMAKTLFAGGAVDGDTALIESTGSLPAFFSLERLGVPFPANEYGEFVGYKTDHDPRARGTSVGPYTSKYMTEVLEAETDRLGVPVLEGLTVFRVLTHGGKAFGTLAYDGKGDDGFVAFLAERVILATGGPAILYRDSVYPPSQTGFTSLALTAGAKLCNFSEWQYGIASVGFRWNLSGTYQQVLPRYFSVDDDGNEHEFLAEQGMSEAEALDMEFLKGYQWPFDSRKIEGSSRVDLLVYREKTEKGRRVYMDFTRNPSYIEKNGFDGLSEETKRYLENSGALFGTPIERLRKMNKKAESLYADHGIFLSKEPLEIAVSAQHNNGGVDVDKNYETSVKGLFAAGEVAGTLGIYRPGGSALNATQTAARRIACVLPTLPENRIPPNAEALAEAIASPYRALVENARGEVSEIRSFREKIQASLSRDFAFLRDLGTMKQTARALRVLRADFPNGSKWKECFELPEFFKNLDLAVTAEALADACIEAAEKAGSRGGSVAASNGKLLPEREEMRAQKILTSLENGAVVETSRPVRPLPTRELWFEKVYNT